MADHNEIRPGDAVLAASGLRDIGQARSNLDLLRKHIGDGPFAAVLPGLLRSLRLAGDPDMALNYIERFAGGLERPPELATALASRPDVLKELIVLFGASRFLSAHAAAHARDTLRLLSDPVSLFHAADKELLAERLSVRLTGAADEAGLLRVMRVFRKEELLRIALRDLLGRADLSETVEELSNLAEVCLQAAYERIDGELRKRHGAPLMAREDGTSVPAGFAVIGMGKLGGRELNFSSDVDLMYVYAADGETQGVPGTDGAASGRITNHQYFVKLAERLNAAIGRTTAEGFVFRVDVRLRPEGQRGPLAQSLGGYEIYYESWGQTWERSALVKARPVAGDPAVGKEFVARITPFVYRKYLDYSAIGEIREMKLKINREVQQKGRTDRDVKLGYGGIREIEFVIQSLQLIYGGRDRALRERTALKALHVLAQKDLLTYQEAGDLSAAYTFLRTVEHRLQMLDDLQTQTLPAGDGELRSLARRTGYRDGGREVEGLLRDYDRHRGRVRDIYDRLLGSSPETQEAGAERPEFMQLLDEGLGEGEATAFLARSGFREPERSYRNLVLLREGQAFTHQTPRGRRAFHELFPLLFREVAASPDPDMAFHHLESFLASQGSWDAFHGLVQHEPRALRALVSVFGNSDYFSRMLIRTPALLDDLLEPDGGEGLGSGRSFGRGVESSMTAAVTISEKLDALRRFKHREELRIGMADLTGDVRFTAVCRCLSRLADACLAGALALATEETARRSGGGSAKGFAVLGAGKLGGRELIYGSDLDILFVFDAGSADPAAGATAFERLSKIAERTISYLSTMTREGAAYRVDTRLRPTGSKGPLVQSLDAYRSYFAGPAETWERQSLLSTRFIAGDRDTGRALIDALGPLLFRDEDPASLAASVRTMRTRMEDELGKEDAAQFNLKQGKGGLVDIEFLVQYLKLRHGRERPRIRVPGTINSLHALRRENVLSEADGRMLSRAYLFLRRLESRLRVVANQSTSVLSRNPEELRTLALRLGYRDDPGEAGRELLRDYEQTRETVRNAFDRVVAP